MTEDILKIIQDKQSGTANNGEKIYTNLTESDLNKIISASVISVVNQIKETMSVATDEWDTITMVEQKLTEFEKNFEINKKKKNKIK